MITRRISSLTLVTMVTLLFSCHQVKHEHIMTGGREVIPFRVLPFDLNQVTLLDGPFKHATELNIKSLLNYEPDRLLARYRSEAGLKPKAEPYHGWEDATISGHSLGHYLSACALMYRSTGDQRFLDRVNYIVDELAACQEANGNGYVGAIPNGKRIFEEEVAKGDIRSRGFDLNGLWSPWYVYHKMIAGLRDAYHLCGNNKALEIERKFTDWTDGIVSGLSEEQVQDMLNCEHGGMIEVLADLYADTGDEKYLTLSRVFHHKAILDPLAQQIDILPGKHGNTNIPKLIGLARRYELTGDTTDRKAAAFFWDRVVHHHSYVTGGHGNHEYFGEPDKLRDRLSDETTESCNVYNMLKLSLHLFEWDASTDVADFYERALFNHILSSQNPVDGRVIYNLSLDMGGKKTYQDPLDFTCCVGTGMENHSKYGGAIYFHNDKELYVSQFIASELDWKEKGLVVRQLTQYPNQQGTHLEFKCIDPVDLSVCIRYPYWAKNGMEIIVNGKEVKVKNHPGSFVAVRRKWKNGDALEVKFPFTLRLESMPDDSNRVAIMYGPLVLAGDLGPVDDPNSSNLMYVPVLLTSNRNPSDWTSQVAEQPNTFVTKEVGKPRDIPFSPFYAFHDRRYSVYFDMFTQEKWDQFQADYQAQLEAKKKLEESTVDFVRPAEMQPERDHNFQGENTGVWEIKERKYRESRGGWFSYDVRVLPDKPVAVAVEYWGGFPGAKTFDILVNGKVIATENISNKKDGQFIYETYPVPQELTRGKHKITVRFQAQPGNTAGPVFGVRVVKL
jgi:DUF1680 family protein